MSESMRGLKRSHMCAELNEKHENMQITVMGWAQKKRDFGQLIFISLRDRSGLLQVVIDGSKEPELFAKASAVKGEYVLAVTGTVALREESQINDKMETGRIEILAKEIRILSEAETPPFSVLDTGVNAELRLKHRYIDLRRPELQRTFMIRHKTSKIVRDFLSDEGFWEVETPMLTKSTPEGARDYLVPSRVYPGNFYALPQSPQVFKQLLMVSGFDKYFQLARCFRDEDLRADRQPEFTQIDIEMSFVDAEDVISLNERLMRKVFKDIIGVDMPSPVKRLTYKEAMENYGSDKPDIRYELKLRDIAEIVKGSEFAAFEDAINGGGRVMALNCEGCGTYPRKKIDALGNIAKLFKAKGIMYIQVGENGALNTSLSKFFPDERLRELAAYMNAKQGDLIVIVADKDEEVVQTALGNIRIDVAAKQELYRPEDFGFVWVTEFPLLEWSEEDGRFYAKHHPFTSPMDEDLDKFDTDPKSMRAKAYDLCVNGYELGGGSIRIYQQEIQQRMFGILGFTPESAHERFGHLLDAFKYGAPPHGGIAFGLDRLIMILSGESDIRDVVAFPKVKDASCLLTDAPNTVDQKQLDELGLAVARFAERG